MGILILVDLVNSEVILR